MAHKTVLVIEDNDLNRKLFITLLELGQYITLAAVDAEKGLEIAEEHHPDLILMDIQLPGMDGLSATRLIKKDPQLKDIPVVALTAYAMSGDEQTAIDAGCSGYISKPIDTHDFLEKVSSFLDQTAASEDEKNPIGHKKRILVVDDEPANIKLLGAMLISDEYEIVAAYNGKEALNRAAEESPDLILLDIMMPGIDGIEATRRIRNNPGTKNIPIVLLTGLDEEENKSKGLEAGADDFLNKSANALEIQTRVNSLLRLKEYDDHNEKSVECEKKPLSPRADEAVDTAKGLPLLLVVEDDEKDAKLLSNYLAELPYRVECLEDGREVIERVEEDSVDVIVLDILLPQMDGYEVCRRLKTGKKTMNIQILMVTCLSDLESKIKGIDLGVDDYLVKPVNQFELKARVGALMRKKAYLDKLCNV